MLVVPYFHFGLSDGELSDPPLIVHHPVLCTSDELRTQNPPGQTKVQDTLCGTGPLTERDDPWTCIKCIKCEQVFETNEIVLQNSISWFCACLVGITILEGTKKMRLVCK